MQKRLKISKPAIGGIIVLLLMVVLVRVYQEHLFYDPFLKFFRGQNSKNIPLPVYDSFRLGLGLFFRYGLNTVLSLGILWLLFRDYGILKLSAILYTVFFVVLIIAFFVVLKSNDPDLLLLFYIRRFIIQPLFLILFVPAFYYQNKA